jgi:ribosomal protein S18 acetylase RimI-like enzyme
VQALLDDAYSAWDATYVPQPHEDWLRWMTEHDEFDPELWLLAEREQELVGCALYWSEAKQRGWLKDLVVRADERGRGLAKALLAEGFRRYRERGARSVGLKVESTNPTGAPQLYARLGFEVDQRYVTWVKRL